MKIEIEQGSWTEVTTQKIVINGERWNLNPFDNQTTKEWLESNNKIGLKSKGRSRCDCCHIGWEKLEGNINCYFTNKGNKVICDKCRKRLHK